jgi:acetolactate synthase-1/2/3 large subunit
MKKGRFLTTGGMGTMGYSIPAGMGAKMYAPDKQVVCVIGDGAFQMSMNELATIRDHQVPLKILIIKNRYLGLVREYQDKTYSGHYSGVELFDYPHCDKIAEAYDMPYFHAGSNSELDSTLDEFLSCPEACLMVCDVDWKDNSK